MEAVDDVSGIRMLEPSDSRNAPLVQHLTQLVNAVYRSAEHGMWRGGADRTRDAELADLIAAGQIAVADRDGRVVGCVQIHDVSPDTVSFGMLATDPEYRGGGVGRALVDFAEQRSRDRGRGVMQLELLVPWTWQHPHKEFLKAWYACLGYRSVRTSLLDETHPHLMPQLATECDLTIYQKALNGGTTR